jgi:hypothetical protein
MDEATSRRAPGGMALRDRQTGWQGNLTRKAAFPESSRSIQSASSCRCEITAETGSYDRLAFNQISARSDREIPRSTAMQEPSKNNIVLCPCNAPVIVLPRRWVIVPPTDPASHSR